MSLPRLPFSDWTEGANHSLQYASIPKVAVPVWLRKAYLIEYILNPAEYCQIVLIVFALKNSVLDILAF